LPGSNGKLIFVLQVFALQAVLEEQIKLVNQGITVLPNSGHPALTTITT
jgi:hypothetical protein